MGLGPQSSSSEWAGSPPGGAGPGELGARSSLVILRWRPWPPRSFPTSDTPRRGDRPDRGERGRGVGGQFLGSPVMGFDYWLCLGIPSGGDLGVTSQWDFLKRVGPGCCPHSGGLPGLEAASVVVPGQVPWRSEGAFLRAAF